MNGEIPPSFSNPQTAEETAISSSSIQKQRSFLRSNSMPAASPSKYKGTYSLTTTENIHYNNEKKVSLISLFLSPRLMFFQIQLICRRILCRKDLGRTYWREKLLLAIVILFFLQMNILRNWSIIPNISEQETKIFARYQYPKFNGKYVPLPLDSTNLPNVLYGCGLTERRVDEIQLHVIGYRRAPSLERLLDQLRNATYDDWDISIPLYLHLDGGATEWVQNIVKKFHWKFGPKILDIRTKSHGLRGMWMTSLGQAAREAGNNTLMLVLEDDIRVSKDYFKGLLALVDRYARNPECRDSNLMGFSLSPIRLEELRKPFTRWKAPVALGERHTLPKPHLAYLSVVPSSWASAYWSDRWLEFSNFYDVRVRPPYYDHQAEAIASNKKGGNNYDQLQMTPPELYVPDSRSNVWPKSWKRFMVDFMYARGNVMIYPSLPGEKGFATTLALSGEHVFSNSRKSRSKNARVTSLIEKFELNEIGMLPRYGNLAVFDLHLQLTTREALAAEGMKFMYKIRDSCKNCDRLLSVWARPGTFSAYSKHHVDTPSICAPDLYTPASALSNQDTFSLPAPTSIFSSSSALPQRYLLFEPQYGANNQMLAIIEALFWSCILDRQLVLPPIFLPRVAEFFSEDEGEWPVSELILQFGNLVDTNEYERFQDSLSLPAPPIGFQEWKRKLGKHVDTSTIVSRILRITRDAVFDTSKHKLTESLINNDTRNPIPIVNMRHLFESSRRRSVADLQHLFGGCSDEVLTFQGLFFADVEGIDKYKLIPDVVSMSDFSKEIYSNVKTQLQQNFGETEYNCFHVRLGDFETMCSAVSSGKSQIPYYKNLMKEGFQCAVTVEKLKSTIQSFNDKPAFVMTDNSTSLLEAVDDSSVVTSEWVQQRIEEELSVYFADNNGINHKSVKMLNKAEKDLLTLIVEQELCKDASHAMLNKYSTVSRRINFLRKEKNISFWKKDEIGKLSNGKKGDIQNKKISSLLQKHDIYVKGDDNNWMKTKGNSPNPFHNVNTDESAKLHQYLRKKHDIYIQGDNGSWQNTKEILPDTAAEIDITKDLSMDTETGVNEIIDKKLQETTISELLQKHDIYIRDASDSWVNAKENSLEVNPNDEISTEVSMMNTNINAHIDDQPESDSSTLLDKEIYNVEDNDDLKTVQDNSLDETHNNSPPSSLSSSLSSILNAIKIQDNQEKRQNTQILQEEEEVI